MTKLLIDTSIVQQAIEALERSVERMIFAEPWSVAENDIGVAKEAITALQSAIKQMESVEPVAWMIHTDNTNLHELDPNREANWLAFDAAEFKYNAARCLNVVEERPLFTHPAEQPARETLAVAAPDDLCKCGNHAVSTPHLCQYTASMPKVLVDTAPDLVKQLRGWHLGDKIADLIKQQVARIAELENQYDLVTTELREKLRRFTQPENLDEVAMTVGGQIYNEGFDPHSVHYDIEFGRRLLQRLGEEK